MASIAANSAFSSKLALPQLLRQQPALLRFILIRAVDELNAQMLNVALAWYVYAATHNPMSLAYAGLVRFLPNIAATLFAGQAADRFDRRWIIGLSLGLQGICAAIFAAMLGAGSPPAGMVYLSLFVIGTAQAFSFPAMSATLPNLVNAQEFPRAIAISSSAFQICTLAGPAIGGLLYGFSGVGMFAVVAALYLVAITRLPFLANKTCERRAQHEKNTDGGPLGGIRYVFSNRLLLALISLDLLAVLLGGVTALLPIYAKDVLLVGPFGLGILRSAPGIGAAIVGLVLAHRTIQRRAGRWMLICVAGFGLASVAFALSARLWLSLAALICAGGFDMVSMVIRQTLVQVSTPSAMRGRVSAVQWLFVGASSELGEFESGVTAALFGAVPAALLGGLGTLAVVALWAKIFPELPRADTLVLE
jgi:MFS family permease